MPILTVLCAFDLASQVVRHELQAIADPEHGQAQIEDAQVGIRSILVIDRGRAAGENDADRVVLLDVFDLCLTGKNNRKNILLADSAGDELGILRPEVENYD